MILLRIIVVLMVSIIFPSLSTAGELERADSLRASFKYEKAIEIYKHLVLADSSNAELMLKLGGCLNDYAELQPKDSQLALYTEAYHWLKKSEVINPNNAEVHFQIARTQGRIALFKGIWSSIGLAKEVKREAEAALKINSNYDEALHIMGRWNREASEKPKIIRAPLGLGSANKEDAVKYLEEAVKIRPDYINHHLELGKTYMSIKKYPAARNQFYSVINLKPQRPIDLKYIKEAKQLLKEIEGKY